jgi:hypothetical protein
MALASTLFDHLNEGSLRNLCWIAIYSIEM